MLAICAINSPAASPNYLEYAKVCARTARDAGYEPLILIDMEGGSAGACQELAWSIGAGWVMCRSRFLPEMEKHLRPDELLIARGAMLRLEIPLLFDDEYVLYTDLDVMFLKPAPPSLPPVKYWGMVHESSKDGHFNSGVSVMNLRTLRATAEVFDVFCRHMIRAGRLPAVCWDQGLINLFYNGLIDTLPAEWNWRPYCGANDDARILHFHGPKPLDTQERIEREYPPHLWPEQFAADRNLWMSKHASQ